jgi:hypothetical protein
MKAKAHSRTRTKARTTPDITGTIEFIETALHRRRASDAPLSIDNVANTLRRAAHRRDRAISDGIQTASVPHSPAFLLASRREARVPFGSAEFSWRKKAGRWIATEFQLPTSSSLSLFARESRLRQAGRDL